MRGIGGKEMGEGDLGSSGGAHRNRISTYVI